ncbi:endoribonuclease Dicer homolog 2 [Tanacetum coccineum]
MANNNGDGSSGSNSDVSIDDQHQFSNARSYQIEAIDKRTQADTLLFSWKHRYPKYFDCYYAATPQAEVARQHLDLKVVEYWGDKAVDYLSAAEWKKEKYQNQLMVMTPAILKDALEHRKRAGASQLPRILGMTASPVKAKGQAQTRNIGNRSRHSRVLCILRSSGPALEMIKRDLSMLRERHESKIRNSNLSESSTESVIRRLSRLNSAFEFCLQELGFGLASKATEADSNANDIFSSYIPAGWLTNHINQRSVDLGLLSAKVVCLIEALAEYRHVDDMRCIIFVERVVTAIVLKSLLCELNPKLFGWKTEYTAGNNSPVQSQSRGVQNKIVDEFREGKVNIIVATSILEEGLDVQSCNLVIRFDLSSTVCSFIQSRGRARMRRPQITEGLAAEPCEPPNSAIFNEPVYRVESTGASLSLSSSISMQELAFKSIFPNNCRFHVCNVECNPKMLKQLASFTACIELHKLGALTDNLVPDTVEKAGDAKEIAYDFVEEQVQYVPPELLGQCGSDSSKLYHFYSINLNKKFEYDIPLQDIVLGVNTELELDNGRIMFDLDADRGSIAVSITYIGTSLLTSAQITISTQFQMTLLRVLLDRNITKLFQSLGQFNVNKDLMAFDYLLLPTKGVNRTPVVIDWVSVHSVSFPFLTEERECNPTSNRHDKVHTLNGLVCSCVVENSLVYTPHNKHVYCTTKRLIGLNANSPLQIREGELTTYKKYYKERHNVDLRFEEESFFLCKTTFVVSNLLKKADITRLMYQVYEGSRPAEVCYILMSPISISTFYSYSFVPSIMHRIESYLIALNLKKMHLDCGQQKGNVPAFKVLEAITTKKCLERFHLESFETLGDSFFFFVLFLKYAASQQLFKSLQDQHEGILSSRREKIISNDSLCRLGCNCNLPGFIRNEPFDPKTWSVPGDRYNSLKLEEEVLSSKRKVYIGNKRTLKKKVVADVAEALIGVFLSEGGEMAALSFMSWLGIKVDFVNTPYERNFTLQPHNYLNVQHLESLLNYKFRDASLLVEALTHGSYMLPDIPRCYQRLEFLGDAVLDYLITVHMYNKYPGMSPGMLTDLRSASVNNDCYAQSAVKVELHKHILHGSQDLHRHIATAKNHYEMRKHTKRLEDGTISFTIEVEAEGRIYKETCQTQDKKMAERLASKIVIDDGTSTETVTCFSLEAHTFVPECNGVVNVVEDKDTCHVPDALKQVENNTYIFHYHIGKGAKPGDPDFNLDASFKSTTQPILSLPAPQTATPPPAEILEFFFFFLLFCFI